MSTKVSIDIKGFGQAAKDLFQVSGITVGMEGRHGIGKSALAKQIGEEMNLPVVEIRLGQMTEGDLIGLPDLEGEGEDRVSRFCLPERIKQCVDEPCLLFLDEINRGSEGVQQAAFQLIGSHALNGTELHPGTRVICAQNPSDSYNVTEGDGAWEDRLAMFVLEPTLEDWLVWAKDRGDIHPLFVDFVRQNPRHLEEVGVQEPGGVYPSRRSWEKVDRVLKACGLEDSAGDPRFFNVSRPLIGNEAAIALVEFAKNYEMVISAEDILNNFKDVKDRLKIATADQSNGFMEKLVDHSADNDWTDKQADNAGKFAKGLPGEQLVAFWTKMSSAEGGNFKNVQKLHKRISAALLKAVNG
jgi:hypothetical protein